MPTSSQRSVLARQEPRISRLPDDFDPGLSQQRADEMVDLAELAGLVLDPWQVIGAEGACRVRSDNKWSAFMVAILANRQNGKGSIMEARQLAGLFVWGSRLQVHTSHEFRTAQKHFERILMLIESTPTLDRMVQRVRRADGEESIETREGTVLQFMARSLKSGRGITGDDVYLDEAFALKRQMMASLMSTMSARSVTHNPQLWLASSAGMPESDVLWGVRESAVDGTDPRLAYMEWSAPDDADADDPQVWADANPALGIRISEDFVRAERASLGDEEFKRERLGIWAPLGGEPVFPVGAWRGLIDEDSRRGDRLLLAVEVAGNRESASIVAVSPRPDGLVHVEVIDNREGTSWLGHRLAELQKRHEPEAIWAIAGSHVDAMLPTWRRDGVRVRLMKFTDYVKACGEVYSLVVDAGLRHLGDEILTAAVEGVAQKWTNDRAAFYWSRKDSSVDITALVAATVGVGVLKRRPVKPDMSRRKRAVIL